MKLFVVGASGYIGSRVFSFAQDSFDVMGTSSRGGGGLLQLDLNESFEPHNYYDFDVVLITAAISAPDICAREYNRAWALNVDRTSELISQVISSGRRVVFFSSDTVYGEREDAFDEAEECNPAGEYAEMKAEVETRFIGNPLFKSIRLSYVFSREDRFTKYLLQCAQDGVEADLFHPFYRTIVHREDVAEGVLALAARWEEFPQRVINFGGPEVLSRIDFAECLRRYAVKNLRFRVTEPGDEFFKNRPRIISMSSEIFPMLLGRSARTMEEAVRLEFDRK